MRWRRMFWLTGLPGWMRFGYSPGWGGMPPCVAYLYWTKRAPVPRSWWPWWMHPEQEKEWLSTQAKALEEELSAIKKRLEELAKEGKQDAQGGEDEGVRAHGRSGWPG